MRCDDFGFFLQVVGMVSIAIWLAIAVGALLRAIQFGRRPVKRPATRPGPGQDVGGIDCDRCGRYMPDIVQPDGSTELQAHIMPDESIICIRCYEGTNAQDPL